MQHRIVQTNFDSRKLYEDVRTARRRALRAILNAYAEGRISRDEKTDQELALQQAFESLFTDARKVTFIADCRAIARYYGGNDATD